MVSNPGRMMGFRRMSFLSGGKIVFLLVHYLPVFVVNLDIGEWSLYVKPYSMLVKKSDQVAPSQGSN